MVNQSAVVFGAAADLSAKGHGRLRGSDEYPFFSGART
jgi:hypothetical protein